LNFTIEEYVQILNDCLYETVTHLDSKSYDNCDNKAREMVKSIRLILKERPWGKNNEGYNNILILAIIFQSLIDLMEIVRLTRYERWFDDTKLVERLWIKLFDCKERVLFSQKHLVEHFYTFLLTNIKKLEEVFKHNWGDSLYMSVELIYDPICNICAKDIRTCEHLVNEIYNGRLCKIIRRNLDVRSSNVVYKPHDYRCRIWPWNINTSGNNENLVNTTFEAALFTFFTVDDFLEGE